MFMHLTCFVFYAGFMSMVYRPDDFIVLVHVPETPNLPAISFRGKYVDTMHACIVQLDGNYCMLWRHVTVVTRLSVFLSVQIISAMI